MTDAWGQQHTNDDASDYNADSFVIRQHLAETRTAVPVKVIAVHGGGVGKPPTVDVQVTVNMTDGQGNSSTHGTIFGIPVARLQGGANAVICDPIAGDYGYMLCADRDISAVKANAGAASNPGSFRRHNLADGVYIGAILNSAAPSQYVQFLAEGIKVVDKDSNTIVTGSAGIALTDKFGNTIVMGSTGIEVNGVLFPASKNEIRASGEITAGYGGGDSVTLQQHTHGGGPPPDPGT